MQQDLWRQIIPLLHARHDASFKAASLGRGSVEGVTMDRVRIRNAGVDVTLGLDESGKILSASFIDRSEIGEYGSFTILYSDYRLVSGLTLPFAEKTLFNGTVDPSQMRTLTAVSVNTPVESALFQPRIDGAR